LPEQLGNVTAHVNWDLAELGAGATVASTYGEGNVVLRGPVDRVQQAYWLAGNVGRAPEPPRTGGFSGYWLGAPRFDARAVMEWSADAYAALRRFFRDTTTAPYRAFVRALAVDSGVGGTALQNSFIVGVPAGTRDTSRGPRVTIAHEMGHMWVGSLSGPQQPWFTEGLNVHYTRRVLLRAGLISVADFGTDAGATVRNYYTSPWINASADSLNRVGFGAGVGGGSAQNLPYVRGSLFFADLDARIRAASSGARTLDDVVVPLLERRRAGTPLTLAVLIDALARELGADIRAHFDAVIMRGETIAPHPNAFGPCFTRRARRYDAGGRQIDGFEWVRDTTVAEATCRAW
jgi:predicted metalloprotease with PDZ domain